MNEWKQKFGSVLVSVVGSVMMMRGMNEGTQWADIPGLFTPLAVAGLILIVWRSWSGKSQMKPPKIKTLGK